MDFLQHSPVTYLLILLNVIFSFKGFQDVLFLDKNLFKPIHILHKKEYGRLFFSGFLHADYVHLFFNMYAFYSFGHSLEQYIGSLHFIVLYFASLMGGNLLSLFLHSKDVSYSALGASGAVSGIVFASILNFPDIEVSLFIFPHISGWLFAILYTLFSLYGIRSKRDNIGHDAHLGGAIVGSLTLVAFYPFIFQERFYLLAAIVLPSVAFLVVLVQFPHLLGLPSLAPPKRRNTVDADLHYNEIRAEKQKELNRILDKINESGIESLNEYEKRFLDMNR